MWQPIIHLCTNGTSHITKTSLTKGCSQGPKSPSERAICVIMRKKAYYFSLYAKDPILAETPYLPRVKGIIADKKF